MIAKILQPFWSEDVCISDEKWDRIEADTNLRFSSSLRNKLQNAVNRYREYSDGYRAALRPSELYPEIERLRKALETARKELVRALRSQPKERPATIRELSAASVRNQKRYISREGLRALCKQISDAEEAAQLAINALPRDAGRQGDPYIGGLLYIAADVFKAAGGGAIYGEKGGKFLVWVCGLVNFRPQSSAAIQQTLKASRNAIKAGDRNL